MRDILKKIKADVVLSSLVCIVLGVLLLFQAETAINLVCKGIAVALMLFGVIYIIGFLSSHFIKTFSLITGLFMLILGIWVWINPGFFASIIPCVIGIILLVHGFGSLKIAMETKENNYDRWWSVLLAAIVTIALGVLIIVFAFRVAAIAVQILGIALIYDGLSNFWVVSKAAGAAKAKRQEDEAVDTEGREL